MKWKIITDSGSDIRPDDWESQGVDFELVPLQIHFDHHSYTDDQKLDLKKFLQQMTSQRQAGTTSCPSPQAYYDAFKNSEAEAILCFTLSSNISGSYNSACTAKKLYLEEGGQKDIFIIDSHSAGGEIDLLIYQSCEWMEEGLNFQELTQRMNDYCQRTNVLFILESVSNLIKNGRIPHILGQVIGLLNIRIIGKRSSDGRIELASKARGNKKAQQALLKEMLERGYNGGNMVISHVLNEASARDFLDLVREKFPQVNCRILECSALCSFYAEEKGLIVGFEL